MVISQGSEKIGKMKIRLLLAALVLGWQIHGSVPETAKKSSLFQTSSGPIFSQTKFTFCPGRASMVKPETSPEDRR